MKQKYLIFIGIGVLFLFIIATSLLSRKSSISPNNSSSRPSITQQSHSQNSSFRRTSLLSIPSPTPTQSPLSAFNYALNTLYSGPNSGPNNANVPSPAKINSPQKQKINQPPTPTPDPVKSFILALNTLFSPSTTTNSVTPQSLNGSTEQPQIQNKVYYPQCGGPYDNDPMPTGCNICDAGCGPTSVAMILSSYVDKKFDPPTVVSLYGQSGLEAGCKGTTIVDAQQILNQNGMKTTDINYYGDSSYDETIQDFRQYLNNGWTLLTLVRYAKDWGHFYWVVSVDENNNIWAYDPGDGSRPVPLNENTVVPAAKYMLAIGVKKS